MTKGLQHIQIRENEVRESCVYGFISCVYGFIEVEHISGKLNLSDMFTKEDKDVQPSITLRDNIVVDPLENKIYLNDFNHNRRIASKV